METIISYLDTMFGKLPNTEQVRRAKEELLQMMEDKYSELIAEGKSPNEAVGTVISEFGNLDELAQTLGLEQEMENQKVRESGVFRRMVSMDQATEYLATRQKSAFRVALGIFFCINCVCGPIVFGQLGGHFELVGVLAFFVILTLGILLIIFGNSMMGEWKFLKNEPCEISMETTKYVHEEKKHFGRNYSIQLVIGVLLCVFCWVPCMIVDEFSTNSFLEDSLAPLFLFLLVGLGVLLIVYNKKIMEGMDILLRLNEQNTFSGSYQGEEQVEYLYPVIGVIMSVYWPTITCLYLIWSFLSFEWYKTWIIWPLAAAINAVIRNNLVKRD